MNFSPVDSFFTANSRQMAAILAGLRLVQAELPRGEFLPQGVHEIFDDGGTIEPLSVSEIDDLCECLNATDPSFVIADVFHLPADPEEDAVDRVLFFSNSDGWSDNLSSATIFSISEMMRFSLPMGVQPRWVPVSDLIHPQYKPFITSQATLDALGAYATYGPNGQLFSDLRQSLPVEAV